MSVAWSVLTRGSKVSFEGAKNNRISSLETLFAKGEHLLLPLQDTCSIQRSDYSMIRWFELNWVKYGKAELRAVVRIAQEELLRVYEKAYGNDHNKIIEMMIDIPKNSKGIEVYLTNGIDRYCFDKKFMEVCICKETKTIYYSYGYGTGVLSSDNE